MRRFISCLIVCFFVFLPFSAFAEGGENCEEKEFKVTQKLCVQKKKETTDKDLEKLRAKLEAQKSRIDRLKQEEAGLKEKSKELKKKLLRLRKLKKRSNLNKENVETVRQRLKKVKSNIDEKLARYEQWKKNHEQALRKVQADQEQLKEADQEQLEQISKVADQVDDLADQVKELANVKDKLYEELTSVKAKVNKVEQKIKEEFPKIWEAINCIKAQLPRFSTKLSLDTFAGGAGFTGFMASEQVRWRPSCEAPVSIQGEFGLGIGSTRGKFPRTAIKAEGGAAFHLIDPDGEGLSLDMSINLGYSQAMSMKQDVTEFRFVYVAPRLSLKPFEHFSVFGGGMFGPVYYFKGKKPDFGRGLQVGISFDF